MLTVVINKMRLLRFAGECSKRERRKEDNFEYHSGIGRYRSFLFTCECEYEYGACGVRFYDYVSFLL